MAAIVACERSHALKVVASPKFLDEAIFCEQSDDEAFFTPVGDGIQMIFFEQAPAPLPMTRFESAMSYVSEESCSSTNLNHFHGEARFSKLFSEGEFSKVRVLQPCCNEAGSVELHNWTCGENPENELVVIKRLPIARLRANEGKEKDECKVHRFACQRHMEDPLTEIGVYSYLSRQQATCSYILKMHKAVEVGSDIWLSLQYANGGDFFNMLTKTSVTSQQVVGWTWQLLQAVEFLHHHRIGHRDISVENLLLHNNDVQLMDFGQAVQTHSASGVPLRYFGSLGKDYCRSPERVVPREAKMKVVAPRFSHPGEVAFVSTEDYLCEVRLPQNSIPLEECFAEPCGYKVPPADMFACGVCLFVMATRMPPWRQARPSDQHFCFVQANGVAQLLKAWRKELQPDMEDLLAMLLPADPHERLDVSECLTHPLFDSIVSK